MVRKPDPVKKERLCDLPSQPEALPSRNETKDGHHVQWFESRPEDVELEWALRHSMIEFEEQRRREQEAAAEEAARKKRLEEEERRRREELSRAEDAVVKFGLARSRLQMMNRPPDEIVASLLQWIDWVCTPSFERGPDPPVVDVQRIRDWLKRRITSPNHYLSVLWDLPFDG